MSADVCFGRMKKKQLIGRRWPKLTLLVIRVEVENTPGGCAVIPPVA
jgi:hypothetical protein